VVKIPYIEVMYEDLKVIQTEVSTSK